MKAVVQRVGEASVMVAGRQVGAIGPGLLVLLGVETGDEPTDAGWLAGKIARLRIFEDDGGKMNRALLDLGASALVVSQFTLAADLRRGHRPSFAAAAPPDQAKSLYTTFCDQLRDEGVPVETGEFGARMAVGLVNDGPVTIWLDSRDLR